MEKKIVVVLAVTLAVVAMAQPQVTPEEAKKSWEDFKKEAGPDFQNALDGVNVEDINKAAQSLHEAAVGQLGVSPGFMNWANGFISGLGLGENGPSAAPGEAPSP